MGVVGSVVEALLANWAGADSWSFILLLAMFSGVMNLEVVFSGGTVDKQS